jgi:hypothetical protein
MTHSVLSLMLFAVAASPGSAVAGRADTGYVPSDLTSTTTAGQGLKVYQDPATGELIDSPRTPDQQAFSQMAPVADYSRVRLTREADGAWVVSDTPPMSVMVRQDPDGSVHQYCVPGQVPNGGPQP